MGRDQEVSLWPEGSMGTEQDILNFEKKTGFWFHCFPVFNFIDFYSSFYYFFCVYHFFL